jgi:hypothetical protein
MLEKVEMPTSATGLLLCTNYMNKQTHAAANLISSLCLQVAFQHKS